MDLLLLFCFLLYTLSHGYCSTLPFSCDSAIYCHGELLHTIQLAKIFDDSKTFVDKKLMHAPNETLDHFRDFMNATNNHPNKTEIEQFVATNFADGNELENWTPTDFKPDPAFIKQIGNVTVRNYAQQLVSIWPQLARKMKEDVLAQADQYSFIPVTHGFIIPGGRFREYYYWDSYWIVRGLLVSEMTDTVRGMIDNFISLVDRFGFVPNGGRVYYLNRSQPPLLTAMAYQYYKHTNDTKWLTANVKSLDKELRFWLKHRTIEVKLGENNLTLAHYRAETAGPRPESYIEDYTTAGNCKDPVKCQQLYCDIKSGAEAGWDFSSRWFFNGTEKSFGNLSDINTRRVVPVDLNAILCGAFKDVAEMYLAIGDLKNSIYWMTKSLEWRKAIELALWDEQDGIWYDLDAKLLQPRKQFYPSAVAPLWARCYNKKNGPQLGRRVAKYLESKGLLNYLGGIPTSLEQTGEQWDFPNAWPPLQDIVVEGLATSGSPEAEAMAKHFAKMWVDANVLGFAQTGDMFEKYDAVNPGKRGGGGEYNVQMGFGWSNGVVLKFIYEYFRSS